MERNTLRLVPRMVAATWLMFLTLARLSSSVWAKRR